jgi:hypothetical protein
MRNIVIIPAENIKKEAKGIPVIATPNSKGTAAARPTAQ